MEASPKDARLSMFFIVAFYVPWCWNLESLRGIFPQLYADNLKCTSKKVDSVLAAARHMVSYVKEVGQEASPSKCVLLSTSRAARRRMTAWRNENEGCFWAVKLDVRDLGGHLDVTLRAVAGNLSSRVKIASTQVIAVGAFLMRFQRMLGLVCSPYLLWLLHGCEGAAIVVSALGAFRAAVARAVWSQELPMTNTPALLSLLVPAVPIPPSSLPAVAFGSFDDISPTDRMRRNAFLGCWTMPPLGPLGVGPFISLSESAQEIGLFWDSEQAGWIRPGPPPLRVMTGSIQHFRGAIWKAWQEKVAADIYGSHQLLASSHLRERDKMLLRAILSGGVWNGFLLSKAKKEDIRCRFCNAPDNDGHLLWDCTFLPFVELRNDPEFLPSMKWDRTDWPRCLLSHGWLPGLTSRSTGSPWAVAASDLAGHKIEKALGPYTLFPPIPLGILSGIRTMPKRWWMMFLFTLTYGRMVVGNRYLILMDRLREPGPSSPHQLSFLIVISGDMLRILMARWMVALTSSRGSLVQCSRSKELSIGVLSLPCKRIWGSILVSTNLNVLRGVAKIDCPGGHWHRASLVKDGDLLATINSMLCLRGVDTVKVSNVKFHATHVMVDNGDVRLEDLIGNDGADTAADLGRFRQQDDVITARRDLLRTRRHWYPIILELHKFMVAISRVEVKHDGYGGTAPDAMVWVNGGLVKPRASFLPPSYSGSRYSSWSPWFLPDSSLANLVLTTPGCCTSGEDSVAMVFPPVPLKAVMPRL